MARTGWSGFLKEPGLGYRIVWGCIDDNRLA